MAKTDYRINADALAYMKKQGMSQAFLDALRNHERIDFIDQHAWHGHMDALGMSVQRYHRIATEGALLGSLKGLHIASFIRCCRSMTSTGLTSHAFAARFGISTPT